MRLSSSQTPTRPSAERSLKQGLRLVLTGTWLAYGSLASAAETQSDTRLDRTERRLSSGLANTALWIDSFFDNPNFVEEDANLRLRVKQRAMFTNKESSEYKMSVSARIKLPNLSRRVSLVFRGNDELVDFEDDGEGEFEEGIEETVEQPSIGIRYFFTEPGKRLNTSFTGGVRIGSGDIYLGPRLRYEYPIGDRWLGRFVERLRWYANDGWETDTRVQLDRRVTENGLYRQGLRLRWQEEKKDTQGVRATLSSAYVVRLKSDAALSFQWTSTYLTEPDNHWLESVFAIRYRKRFYRDWLFFEAAPELAFQDLFDWHATPGIRFSVEAVFSGGSG